MKSAFQKISAYGFLGRLIASCLLPAVGQVPLSPLLDSWEQHVEIGDAPHLLLTIPNLIGRTGQAPGQRLAKASRVSSPPLSVDSGHARMAII